jgi:hypothetical protein
MSRSGAWMLALGFALLGCERRVSVVGQSACGDHACDASTSPLPVAWDASFEKPGDVRDLELLGARIAGTWWGIIRWRLGPPELDRPPVESLFELEFTPSDTSTSHGSFSLRCVGNKDCDPLLIQTRFSSPDNDGQYELTFVNDEGHARGSFSNGQGTGVQWNLPFQDMRIERSNEHDVLAFSFDFGGSSAIAALGAAVLVEGHAPDGGVSPPSQLPDAGSHVDDAGAPDAGSRDAGADAAAGDASHATSDGAAGASDGGS